MNNLYKSMAIASAALVWVSCSENLSVGLPDSPKQPDMTKIINTNQDAVPGNLVIYLDEECVSLIESDVPTPIDSVADALNASLNRVFDNMEDTEGRARAYGLHRWYQLVFSDSIPLSKAAEILAGTKHVQRVQFNTRARKTSDGISRQHHAPLTRSTGTGPFNDPSFSSQWHYRNIGDKSVAPTAVVGADINVVDAWRLTAGDPSIIVAVVDEGVQYDHPDLAANMWQNPGETMDGVDNDGNGFTDDVYGCNFVSNGPVTYVADGNVGHGTHVAGTVAAVNHNGKGVCGVAGGSGNGDGVRIMSCQIFDGFRGGDAVTSARATRYAADYGACILQCSYGFPAGTYVSDAGYKEGNGGTNTIQYDALKYFMEKSNCPEVMDGGLVIFSSGNDGAPMSGYPGACSEFISVTAFASDHLPACYTNYGPGCNISAPGGEYYTGGNVSEKATVLSTMPTVSMPMFDQDGNIAGTTAVDYGYMQGTSMACPHVSGVAALGLSYAKKLGRRFTYNEMVSMILTSVDDMDSRMTGKKVTLVGNSLGEMALMPYRKKMGTGSINAWRLLMQIEGTPCVTAKTGESQKIDISEYFGGGGNNITYLGVTMNPEDMEALGLTETPSVSYGRLNLHPTKLGSAKLTVKAIAGGDVLGDGSTMGGMEISREISIISRSVSSKNGGWL